MEYVRKLKAALAAVPVLRPCTAEAVAALYGAGRAAARQLSPALPAGEAPDKLQQTCAEQQLPGACMPVLGWLAAGLSSGLPPAARQQAHEVACVLLGVVSLVVPKSLQTDLWVKLPIRQTDQNKAVHLLQQLGANTDDVCRQLAKVAAALVATLPSNSATTTTTTSSREAPSLQQLASQALAWKQTSALFYTWILAAGKAAVVPALTGSGLFQEMLEGTLLLLAQDPAGYPHPSADGVHVFDYLTAANSAAMILGTEVGNRVWAAWLAASSDTGSRLNLAPRAPTRSYHPWMPAMFKLQVLLLAKMQWDVRQCPEDAVTDKVCQPWPSNYLGRGLLSNMVSPCVAGDLLRQRAPGLVPHSYQVRTVGGPRRVEGVGTFLTLGHHQLADFVVTTSHSFRACLQGGRKFEAMEPEDLALLVEVAELYCLVSPPGRASSVHHDPWHPLQPGIEVCPYPVLARFAATCGEALLSIAEYLVEDVLLVASGAAEGAAKASAAVRGSSAGTAAASSSTHGRSDTDSVRDNSSRKKQRPRMGGRNPKVTQDHHVTWAQHSITNMGLLMVRQEWVDPKALIGDCGHLEREGYGVGVVHGLFNSNTAPRLLRLLEVALRTPELQGPELMEVLSLLPLRLPLLHTVGSSSAGSRALLSAVTTAVKSQQVGQAIMSALVKSRGKLAPAAAAVAAAVPGRMGQAMAQQVLKQPDRMVWAAVQAGQQLASRAMELMVRAAALLDPVLAPLAAYLAATQLPPGQDSKPWAVEGVLLGGTWLFGHERISYNYQVQLLADPLHMRGIMAELTAALSLQQAAAARKQATKLAKAAGGGAAEVEQLRQQLQGMWQAPGLASSEQEGLAAGFAEPISTDTATTSSSSPAPSAGQSQLPHILQFMCRQGLLRRGEVLAAGDPSRWSSALGPTSEDDLRVASTALLAACKAAGAVAQLPGLLGQLGPIMAQQAWGRGVAASRTFEPDMNLGPCARAAGWALLLAPLLAVLLPAQQAAELQEVAAGSHEVTLEGLAVLAPEQVTHVLGLLGQVVAPGAPGCSYSGCCNMEGRSETDLQTLVCSKCRGARYCCREHQVAHWKAGHREVCRAAQAAAQQVQGMAGVGAN